MYSLISSCQDMWTSTQDNKLQSVKPCVPVWLPFDSIRKDELMLTCLRIRHSCPTHMHLLQVAPHFLLHNVVCPLQFHTSWRCANVLTNAKLSYAQGTLNDTLGDDWHGFVSGSRVAASIYLTLFCSLQSHCINNVVSRISLGHLQSVLLPFLSSAFIDVSSYILVETSVQPYKFIIIFNFVICYIMEM
jgi:hypothetical protein